MVKRWGWVVVLGILGSVAAAQDLPPAPAPGAAPTVQGLPPEPDRRLCDLNTLLVCAKHVAEDEKGILLSPLRAPAENLWWIVPFGVATGVSVHFDTDAIRDLGVNPSREDKFNKLSDYAGLYGPFAAAGAGYVAGRVKHDDYLKETAILSAEAMADATILDQGMKYALDREYPLVDNARGGLWPGGPKSWPNHPSMPSEHTMNVWAFAHVVAGQYNGIATQALVYGAATTVSVSRVLSREHFPSDVVVGSTLGWLIGGYVLHHRSLEHGTLLDVSTVETPLGSGVQVRIRLGRGE
ncbi:MAG TPA: phosphatase PAP2 family protein [Acidobacteriaceae bacterium]|nr:phosphatase PAP2 family protein [Acidobacteriaceae bacterium]